MWSEKTVSCCMWPSTWLVHGISQGQFPVETSDLEVLSSFTIRFYVSGSTSVDWDLAVDLDLAVGFFVSGRLKLFCFCWQRLLFFSGRFCRLLSVSVAGCYDAGRWLRLTWRLWPSRHQFPSFQPRFLRPSVISSVGRKRRRLVTWRIFRILLQ